MRRLLAFALLVLCCHTPASSAPGDVSLARPVVVSPRTQLGDGTLQSKYDDLWKAYQAKVNEGFGAVEKELARLFEEAKTAGNLDLAIFWGEVKNLLVNQGRLTWEPIKQKKDWKSRFGESDFPEDLTAVVRKCEGAVDEAKAMLEAGYKDIEVELTKSDKLTEAIAIRNEFKGLWSAERSASVTPVHPKPKSVAEKLGLKGKAEYDARTQVLTVRYACNSTEELNDFDMSSGPNSATVRNRQLVVQADAKITHMTDFESVTLAGTIIVPSVGSTKGSIGFELTAGQKIFAYGNMSIRTPETWKDIGGLQWNQPTRFRLYFGKPEITLATDTTKGAIPCGLMTVGRPIISGGKLGVSFTDLTISGKVSERVARMLAE
jgi:hypothetical protein